MKVMKAKTWLEEDHWTAAEVRDDLRGRSDCQWHSRRRIEDPDRVIRRAYEDILHRAPDAGSRGYVDRALRDHWSEADVARELRHSDEYRNNQ